MSYIPWHEMREEEPDPYKDWSRKQLMEMLLSCKNRMDEIGNMEQPEGFEEHKKKYGAEFVACNEIYEELKIKLGLDDDLNPIGLNPNHDGILPF